MLWKMFWKMFLFSQKFLRIIAAINSIKKAGCWKKFTRVRHGMDKQKHSLILSTLRLFGTAGNDVFGNAKLFYLENCC